MTRAKRIHGFFLKQIDCKLDSKYPEFWETPTWALLKIMGPLGTKKGTPNVG